MIAGTIFFVSAILIFPVSTSMTVNADDSDSQATHYTVNIEENLSLDDSVGVTSENSVREPKHYTVNLSESLTLSDSTG
jgi:hypothetical protein